MDKKIDGVLIFLQQVAHRHVPLRLDKQNLLQILQIPLDDVLHDKARKVCTFGLSHGSKIRFEFFGDTEGDEVDLLLVGKGGGSNAGEVEFELHGAPVK